MPLRGRLEAARPEKGRSSRCRIFGRDQDALPNEFACVLQTLGDGHLEVGESNAGFGDVHRCMVFELWLDHECHRGLCGLLPEHAMKIGRAIGTSHGEQESEHWNL